MQKLVANRGVGRVIPGIIVAMFLLTAGIQGAVLQDLRIGLTEDRTRLVYQLDESSTYSIDWDSSSVVVSFDTLTLAEPVLAKLEQITGGLVTSVGYEEEAGKITVSIQVSEPFHIRFFDLRQPDRLVVDLYPQQQIPLTETPVQAEVSEPEPSVIREEAAEKVVEPAAGPEGEVVGTEPEETGTGVAIEGEEVAPEPALETETAGEISERIPIQEESSSVSWLYIVLPIVIVLLIIIGLQTLRRASRKEAVLVQDFSADKGWASKAEKFRPLTGIGEMDEVEEVIEMDAEGEIPEADAGFAEEPPEVEEEGKEAEAPGPEEVRDEGAVVTEETPLEEKSADASPAATEEEKTDSSALTAAEPEVEKEKKPGADDSAEEELVESMAESLDETEDTGEADGEADTEEQAKKLYQPAFEAAYGAAGDDEDSLQRPVHKKIEQSEADLNFEEGKLTWPVHIIVGERAGRVMVVDDEPEIVSSLEEFLKRERYEVLGLTDSVAALDEYKKWSPDLVIADVVMPNLSGVDMVRRLRDENERVGKVIFLSGRTERDTAAKVFGSELDDGEYEFFRKPLSLVQVGGRIRDYFSEAQQILHLDLLDAEELADQIKHLTPHQLVPLQRFLWDKIFEISSSMLGRRIEPYYITDRMEPPTNYMRRVGCQEREDYCIANICFSSNPMCAADKIRGELEIMRQVMAEFREEYVERVDSGIGEEELETAQGKSGKKAKEPKIKFDDDKGEASPPPRKTLRRLVSTRKR